MSQTRGPPTLPGRLEAADRQTPAARVQDHRPHMDCGAQLRLAWAQSTIEQGLRVLRAELRDTHRNRRNTPYAQPPRSGMRLFKHALRCRACCCLSGLVLSAASRVAARVITRS